MKGKTLPEIALHRHRASTNRRIRRSPTLGKPHRKGLWPKPVCDNLRCIRAFKLNVVTGLELEYTTDWRKIVKLDCWDRPGLRAKDFFGLFAQCDACELIVARQVFAKHHCRPLGDDGLELTDEELTDKE